MEVLHFIGRGRIPLSNELLRRASDSSSGSKCGPNPCEKPTSSSTFTLPIILGVAVPLVGAAILFMILQRRHTRKMREEDENDLHASLDFGLGDVPQLGRSKRAEAMSRERDNSSLSRRQISMDMTINNAYLPSYETKSSRQSLDSLSISLRKEDPYGPLSHINSSDAGSTRARARIASANGAFINSTTKFHEKSDTTSDSFSTSETTTLQDVAFPPRVNSLIPFQAWNKTQPGPLSPNSIIVEPPRAYNPANSVIPTTNWSNGQDIKQQFQPHTQSPRESERVVPTGNRVEDNYIMEFNQVNGFKHVMGQDQREISQPSNNLSSNALAPQSHVFGATNLKYNYGLGTQMSHSQTGDNMNYKQSQGFTTVGNNENYFNPTYDNPKITSNRYSTLGSRPLPPNTATDSDDPEIRANRIRSFYREYFDDNTPAPDGRYEKNNYLNRDNKRTYYDPNSNNFVLPYVQPVTRRAMTPPPMNRANGPGRARNTSIGVMDYTNYGFTNVSSDLRTQVSSRRQGPPPRQPTLPFGQLNSLPTPGKMKDDMSTINTLDFAPPVTYRERTGSRSRSPFSETRPY